MEFPFPTYNSNGTVNQGLALCGPGNTFWHPPMMPQPQSDTETFWHPPLVPPTKTNTPHISKRKDYSSSSDDSSESCGPSCSKPPNKTEDSTMDSLQDDELFSAYLHPHDEKTVSVEGGHTMYVNSFFQ
jgi:GATA-binding protein